MSFFVRLQRYKNSQSIISRLAHTYATFPQASYTSPLSTIRLECFSTTTMSDSAADHDKKRGNEGNAPNNKNNKNNKNKRRKKVDTNHSWRENRSGNEVHPGSYANPAMRELFGVTIPPDLLPPETPVERPSRNAAAAKPDEDSNENKKLFSKKKVAFLLAYLGTGYSGFQTNEGIKTLQAEFELALLKSGLLNPLNFGYFHKYSWSTSGRTDKGVHACAQVCSAKIQMLPDQTMDDVRELINQHLPAQFRVLDVVRATNSFCAKTGRNKVRYQYMVPSFFFFDRNQLVDLMREVAPKEGRERRMGVPLDESEVSKIQEKIKNYRVTPEQLKSLQAALRQFEGTHSFHNFTKGLSAKDPSASRYIMSFNVEKPMVFENGMEWVPTQVVGQSFLLHQIRKMISVGLDSVRMGLPNMVSAALEKNCRIVTNLAPAQGLFMEMSFYDTYNELKAATADVEPLDWATEGTPVNDRWKAFRNDVIMEHVVKEEEKTGNFIQYLYNHEHYFDRTEDYESLGASTNTSEDQEESK